MNETSYPEQRDEVIDSLQRDEQQLRKALKDLARAAGKRLQIAEHIKRAPLPWLLGGFVLGLWLGRRGRAN